MSLARSIRKAIASQKTPAYAIDSSSVEVLQKPSEFYGALLSGVQASKFRVHLSSLYFGTEDSVVTLVDALKKSMSNSPGLEASILADYMRSTRPSNKQGDCSVTLLQPLVDSSASGRCRASLYHTPLLRGIWKKLVPNKFNETVSLQHMKAYIFDNDVLLSGANLNDSYFSDRQDRYVLFRNCPELADYLHNISGEDIGIVAKHSFQIPRGGSGPQSLTYDDRVTPHPLDDSTAFMESMRASLLSEMESEAQRTAALRDGNTDGSATVVYPTIQLGSLQLRQDQEMTSAILRAVGSGEDGELSLSSAYFNIVPEYEEALLRGKSSCSIITAHPEANGFYGAKWPMRMIPPAYTMIEKEFRDKVVASAQQNRVKIFEYHKDAWTFHAKGLWGKVMGDAGPSVTMVGSPNFGFRSVERDLESQVVVVTDSEVLQRKLQQERDNLFLNSSLVTNGDLTRPNRLPGRDTRFCLPIVRTYGVPL